MQSPAGSIWLTPEDAATRLQLHPNTVREFLRAGRLKGVQMPGTRRWRINETAIEEFMGLTEARK